MSKLILLALTGLGLAVAAKEKKASAKADTQNPFPPAAPPAAPPMPPVMPPAGIPMPGQNTSPTSPGANTSPTPPFFPPHPFGGGGSGGGAAAVALSACLDANLSAEERAEAMALLGAPHGAVDAEQIDAAASAASASGHPQLAFCLLAKAQAVRSGLDNIPGVTV